VAHLVGQLGDKTVFVKHLIYKRVRVARKRGRQCRYFGSTKRLAFGSSITTWRHVEQLEALGITHVVNLRRNKHGKKVKHFKNLRLPFRDDKKPRPDWFYRQALDFYERAMRRPDSKMLVMCRCGVCRSASLVFFLLRASGIDVTQAKGLLAAARSRAYIGRPYFQSGEEFLGKKTTG
jgi:hypothetical protein